MIEVCSESSFQPILQLYLYLPTLILSFTENNAFNTNQSVHDWFNNIAALQFWSILTSCISLSWSFNFHQSVCKNGALDYGANPIGRILLLLSNILQISSRLVVFVLFAYTCGDGNFFPIFLGVLAHIVVMSVIYSQQHAIIMTTDNWKQDTRLHYHLYQAIVNGISNLYLWNIILPLPSDQNYGRNHKKGTFQHQAIVDSISILENIVIVILAFFFVDEIPPELLMYGIGGHLLGLFLKCIYYYQFHIWSPVLELKNPYKQHKQ